MSFWKSTEHCINEFFIFIISNKSHKKSTKIQNLQVNLHTFIFVPIFFLFNISKIMKFIFWFISVAREGHHGWFSNDTSEAHLVKNVFSQSTIKIYPYNKDNKFEWVKKCIFISRFIGNWFNMINCLKNDLKLLLS